MGLVVGVISMSVPLYISEISPINLRGSLGAANQFAVTIGILASYVVGILAEEHQATSITCQYDVDDGINISLTNLSLSVHVHS